MKIRSIVNVSCCLALLSMSTYWRGSSKRAALAQC